MFFLVGAGMKNEGGCCVVLSGGYRVLLMVKEWVE